MNMMNVPTKKVDTVKKEVYIHSAAKHTQDYDINEYHIYLCDHRLINKLKK
jgi:hypothetical protein